MQHFVPCVTILGPLTQQGALKRYISLVRRAFCPMRYTLACYAAFCPMRYNLGPSDPAGSPQTVYFARYARRFPMRYTIACYADTLSGGYSHSRDGALARRGSAAVVQRRRASNSSEAATRAVARLSFVSLYLLLSHPKPSLLGNQTRSSKDHRCSATKKEKCPSLGRLAD
jgi:hypothetical protein